ncbi:MAG: glycosyltransferase [Gemmatimonadaceae bacterium]
MSAKVSIIIPAFEAAESLGMTLGCVLAQTMPQWEVVIVDDGSTDDTRRVAAEWVARDPRIRLVSTPHRGVSAARNEGMSHARYDLFLFLDADAEIHPAHLERLTEALAGDLSAAVAVSGWGRIATDGGLLEARSVAVTGDLFDLLATTSLGPIHACLARRRLVDEAGGFDVSLVTCADWDLWQRIARTGASFLALPDVGAWYRMLPASASMDGAQMLADALVVQARGHAPDSRVRSPLSLHAAGLPMDGLAQAQFGSACWSAGLHLGAGLDPCPLLKALDATTAPGLEPESVAQGLFEAMVLPRGLHPDNAASLWPAVERDLERFLEALERHAEAVGLARRTQLALAELVTRNQSGREPLTIGRSHVVRVELTAAVPDVRPPAAVERLRIGLSIEGRENGSVDLPVFGGIVPAAVVADAAAAKVAWDLLGQFLGRTIYTRKLTIQSDPEGASVWRGGRCLAEGLDRPPHHDTHGLWLHEAVGWTVFLQELWGLPEWSGADFYDPARKERSAGARAIAGTTATIEISGALQPLDVGTDHLWVDCQVGGASIGWVWVPNTAGRITPQQLRAAITTAGGLEMCVAAVREGVVGHPLDQPGNLRARLAEAAHRAAGGGAHGDAVMLGRYPHMPIGSAGSRRAVLPGECLSAIRRLTNASSQPLVAGAQTSPSAVVHYAPELLAPPPVVSPHHAATHDAPRRSGFDRHYFESLFASGADPWKYRSDYEILKYQQTLDLIPAGTGRVLEMACAEGDFTVALATRAAHVVAADISELALTRAAERCAHQSNITYRRLDMAGDELPGGFDVIVCSEVLYFVGQDRLPHVARKLAGALAPGGRLILAHANLQVDAPDEPGFDWSFPYGARHIGRTLAADSALRWLRELRSRHYRIQLFAREERPAGARGSLEPEVIEPIESVDPIPTVAATFRTSEERVHSTGYVPQVTARLPILAYHRVAPEGARDSTRYRLTPEQFERQLAYLSASGFHTVTAEQWRQSAELRRPLPGRAVLLTFDDGYRDFAIHAWPLLQRYGFGAHLFLVSERVGGFNQWDAASSEKIPLLDWDEIGRLPEEGVAVGSHSASHRLLTSLSPTEVADECLRSRATLQERLGRTVSTIAYPWGDVDEVVQHLAGAAGYVHGFSCRPGPAAFNAPLLALPRIEVTGFDTLETFIRKLGPTRV